MKFLVSLIISVMFLCYCICKRLVLQIILLVAFFASVLGAPAPNPNYVIPEDFSYISSPYSYFPSVYVPSPHVSPYETVSPYGYSNYGENDSGN